jgi:hypothetical protein
MFGSWQQRPRQEGVVAHEDYIFGGAPRTSSLVLQGENPRSGFIGCTSQWLKDLSVNSDFLEGENSRPLIDDNVCVLFPS